LGIGGA